MTNKIKKSPDNLPFSDPASEQTDSKPQTQTVGRQHKETTVRANPLRPYSPGYGISSPDER